MATIATATIEGIAAGGAGVARVDGLVVFVPRTAPGDRVRLSYVKRGRLGEGRLVEMLAPGPERVTPRCRHYIGDACGGCQLQHLNANAQLAAKRTIVHDALVRIARRAAAVEPVVPSPDAWEYRNKLTLAMRRSGGRWIAGLHRWDDVRVVFDLEECPITHPRVMAGWREVLAASAFLPEAPELRGAVRFAGDTLAFVLEGGTRWTAAHEFVDRTPSLNVVRWIDARGTMRVVADRAADARPVVSFEQVNPAVAISLHRAVVDTAMQFAPAAVVDAYAGGGETAELLHRRGVRVTAIELDREAATHAARRLAEPSIAVCARVEDVLPRALPADVVILNPPRAGVEASVCATLGDHPPRAIVYVSCNPATLARDIARLPGFRVGRTVPFDMFPQTAHVETLCLLEPEGS